MIQEFYAKRTPQEKLLLYVALTCVVIFVFDLVILKPSMEKLKQMDEGIQVKTNGIKRFIRFLAYKDKILNHYKTLDRYETSENVEETEVMLNFDRTVEELAVQNNISIKKLNRDDVVYKKGYLEYYSSLECEGKQDDMLRYMYQIDSTDNMLRIVKFNMTKEKATPEGVTASIKVAKLVIDSSAMGKAGGMLQLPEASSGSKTGADASATGGTVNPANKGLAPVSLGPSEKPAGGKTVKLGPDGLPLAGERTKEEQQPGIEDASGGGEFGDVPQENKTRIQAALEASGQGGQRVEISDMETLWSNFAEKKQASQDGSAPATQAAEKPSFWKQFLGK
jgi:hypothetical protein